MTNYIIEKPGIARFQMKVKLAGNYEIKGAYDACRLEQRLSCVTDGIS